VRPNKMVCPKGDFAFYQRAVGQAVPSCPTHKLSLMSATAR
jgi:hypothetical protein